MNIKIIMYKDKETKNTIRYKENTEDDVEPIIGTIYINKRWAEFTETITITVERDDTI